MSIKETMFVLLCFPENIIEPENIPRFNRFLLSNVFKIVRGIKKNTSLSIRFFDRK